MNFLTAPFQEWSALLFILLAGAVPTQMWRWFGALASRSMDEESEFLKWVKAVATALVAGLIAKIVVFPSGALIDIPLVARVGSISLGFCVYYFTRPRIIFGILAGEAALIGSGLLL